MWRSSFAGRAAGYCFEVNQLLYLGLESAGFDVRQALARVHARGDPTGFTHQITLVRVEGEEWIADAGFGAASIRAPIRHVSG